MRGWRGGAGRSCCHLLDLPARRLVLPMASSIALLCSSHTPLLTKEALPLLPTHDHAPPPRIPADQLPRSLGSLGCQWWVGRGSACGWLGADRETCAAASHHCCVLTARMLPPPQQGGPAACSQRRRRRRSSPPPCRQLPAAQRGRASPPPPLVPPAPAMTTARWQPTAWRAAAWLPARLPVR